MLPEGLKAIRLKLGLSQDAFGRALGFSGDNVRNHVHRLESGARGLNPAVARLAEMFSRFGVPKDFLQED